MGLPSIFDLCVPRDDVLKGTMADSDFAAKLSHVLAGRASPDYGDPVRFFANTYPTEGLQELLSNICGRLSGAGGAVSAVFRLDTSFGGGKTHGLIALVHAARSGTAVPNITEFVSKERVPADKVRIAAFDGEDADPANGRPMGGGIRAHTPWGEIAYQLAGAAGYETIRRSDEERIAPGADTIAELFGSDPVLIVLDEMSDYLRRVQHMGGKDQLTAFLKALFTAAEGNPRAAVVYTLAVRSDGKAVDAFAEENEFLAKSMEELESTSARKATNLNPTKDDETAKVIRRRLFGSIDDARAAEVIQAYQALWAAKVDKLPDLARRLETVEDFTRAYPFHPDVLDTLTDKTATLANFQRVRGMLRILAKTVADVWARRPKDASAIHLHHVDLSVEPIRREFTTRLQQGAFIPAINNDIAGTAGKGALAQDLDEKHYKGLLPYGSYVARTAFIHTLAFNNDLKGVHLDHLRFSILGPEAELDFVDDARGKFRLDSAYLDDRPGAPMRFLAEANLTQIIAREERHVEPGEARPELDDRIRQIFGGSMFELVPNPGVPTDIPDDLGEGKPRLALMSYDAFGVGHNLAAVPELIAKLYERKGAEGSGLRSLRNNVVFLLADEGRIADMKRAIARRIALRTLKTPDRLNELAEHQRQQVVVQEAKSEHAVALEIQQCYRHILYPSRNGIGDGAVALAHAVIDIQNASEKPGAGQIQVVRQLQSQNKLREATDQPDSPAYIRDRTPLKKGQMTTKALRDEFRRDPALPILLSDDVFLKAIRKGIEEGTYIYQREGLLAGHGDPLPILHIDEQSIVSTMDYAKLKGFWPRQAQVQQQPAQIHPAGEQDNGSDEGSKSVEGKPTDGGSAEGGSSKPPVTDGFSGGSTSTKEFSAEGVLKEALRKVFEQARAAKVTQVDRVTVRVFEPGDAFKLIPVAGTVGGAKKVITLNGAFETTENSKMEFEFEGSPSDASSVREYFERQFKAAKEATLNASMDFAFDAGLLLDGDQVDKFVEKLTRFASAAAYVEARAEVK
jgi:hypothetical protein